MQLCEHQVVIHDITNKYAIGTILGDRKAKMLRDKITAIPVHPELIAQSGVSGYSFRSWGSGIEISASVPMYHAPMMLAVHPEYNRLNYAFALCKDNDRTSETVEGNLRLVIDHKSVNRTPVSLHHLKSPSLRCNWASESMMIVEGYANMSASDSGLLYLSMYGALPNTRLLWCAVSQSV